MTFSSLKWEPQSKREARRKEMFEFVEQWARSGETQRSWCSMHGVQYAKFQYWLRKYRAMEGDGFSGFVDLVASESAAGSACTLEIHFPWGAVVKMPSTEWEIVRQLVG